MDFENIKQLALSKGCTVRENEPMSRYTTFKIGGAARLLIFVPNLSALKALLKNAMSSRLRYLFWARVQIFWFLTRELTRW